MKKYLGLQLWSIRDVLTNEEDIRRSFAALAEYGYDEIETAGFAIDPVLFAKIAKENGLRIINTHYDFNEMLNNTEKTIELHQMLGTKYMGVGGNGNLYVSKEKMLETIDQMNEVGERVSKYGFKFTYHNHSREFTKYDGKTIYDYMIEKFDGRYALLELDTYWAQNAGIDVCDILPKIGDRMEIIHLKDMEVLPDGSNTIRTEIGHGNMNFDGIIRAAEKLGVQHYVVEQDDNWLVSSLESAKTSAAYLKANWQF